MRQMRIKMTLSAVLVCGVAWPQTARAGIFENVLVGLTEAGFNFVGTENFLSGGADLVVGRQFNGETLDFGATELTLQGTPTLQFTTGGRGLQVLDFSLNTANAPLTYTLTTDSGNQLTTIDGSFFLDLTGSINSFGSYDLQLQASSRQTITQDGRFGTEFNEITEADWDIGPIDLQGNLFADLLATLTDPIFQLLGVENIFAQFSGAAQFEAQLSALAEEALAKARAGQPLNSDEINQLGALSAMADEAGVQITGLSLLDEIPFTEELAGRNTSSAQPGSLVPEPASLLMLLLATPALLQRRTPRR